MPWIRTAENVLRMAFEHTYNGRQLVNVYHARWTPDPAITTISDLAPNVEHMRTAWQGFLVQFPDNLTFTGVSCFSLDDDITGSFDVAPDPAEDTTGGQTGAAITANVAVLVDKVPGSAPRGFRRGRVYWPPLIESEISEAGIIDSTRLSNLQAAADLLFAAWENSEGSAIFEAVVPSWETLGPPPEGDVEVEAQAVVSVTGLSVQSLVATQRRRLRG